MPSARSRCIRRSATIPALLLWACPMLASPSLSGCGGSAEPAESPAAEAGAPTTAAPSQRDAPEAEKAETTPAGEFPAGCKEKDGFCLPPARFVKKLCAGFHPDAALALFGKGSPWTRGYLKGDVEAWNASGGVSSGDKLVFDEEVIVLVRRVADAGGIQVSGAGASYDVLRWDGSCATLADGEMTTKPPPRPKHAKLKWGDFDDATKTQLLEDASIAKVNADRKKECKGVTMGDVSTKCVKAVDALSLAIVAYVRGGGQVPKPAAIP